MGTVVPRTSYFLPLTTYLYTSLVSSSSKITAASFVVFKPMSSTALMTLLATAAAITLWSCFFTLFVKFFKQIVFSHFFNGHIQRTAGHGLDISVE